MARKCEQCVRGRAQKMVGKGAKAKYICLRCLAANHAKHDAHAKDDDDG